MGVGEGTAKIGTVPSIESRSLPTSSPSSNESASLASFRPTLNAVREMTGASISISMSMSSSMSSAVASWTLVCCCCCCCWTREDVAVAVVLLVALIMDERRSAVSTADCINPLPSASCSISSTTSSSFSSNTAPSDALLRSVLVRVTRWVTAGTSGPPSLTRRHVSVVSTIFKMSPSCHWRRDVEDLSSSTSICNLKFKSVEMCFR